MLRPQINTFRSVQDLSGLWEAKADPEGAGESRRWHEGFGGGVPIGVPGSWNEQLAELGLMYYVGALWYQRRFFFPGAPERQRFFLRFDSADYHATVWLNGHFVGNHTGGFLPFQYDVTPFLQTGENRLVVRVDNRLSHDTIPQGITEKNYLEFGRPREQTFPPTAFDFFVYGGLNRPVRLIGLPRNHLRAIQVGTAVRGGGKARITVSADFEAESTGLEAAVEILDGAKILCTAKTPLSAEKKAGFELDLEDCQYWCPEDPYLYRLRMTLRSGTEEVDGYTLSVGVRQVEVREDKLLLNGRPVFLKGFGKHEDFPVLGKGLSIPVLVKDLHMLKWIGANSFRTSHYPYAEEWLEMSDRMGILIIDEVPAVSLNFRYATERTLAAHKQALQDLIGRDRNHPCVIAWSVANEPGIWGEEEAASEKARRYWREIYRLAKSLDPSRPVTIPACARWGEQDLAFQFSDFLSVNRYWGWYEFPGQLERAGQIFRRELQRLWKKYKKPILVTEFGADTIDGIHATYPQLFTEEYQIQLIRTYFEVIESLPFTIGEHIWNFADFRTAQNHRRVVLNKKGVFNRIRDPKSAAFFVKEHWQGNR